MAKSKPEEPEVIATPEGDDIFSTERIRAFSPDDTSIPAAQKVLKKGGFGKVEATADGKGWWVVCKGLTDTYQTSVRVDEDGDFTCDCTCPSPKYPCKHVLALLLYLHDHPEERAEPEAPKHAATDFEALLRSVFQNPDDDTPRLVFADFLEENDQPERAALIRVQCELARVKATSERGKELKKEERALLAKLKPLVGTLPEGMEAAFHRGFIELSLNLHALRDIGLLPERFTKLFRDGWIETARMLYSYDSLTEEHATLLGLVAELDYSNQPLTDDGMLALVTLSAAMKATGRLCRVKVAKSDRKEFETLIAAQSGTAAVAAFPTRLEDFRHHDGLTRQSLDLLIRAGRLRAVREVALEGRLGYEAAEQLASADLNNLGGLRLIGWDLNPEAISLLANSAGLTNLTIFGIHGSRLGPDHIAALTKGPNFSKLTVLFLDGGSLSDAALRALAGAKQFRVLQHLEVMDNDLTTQAAADFLRSPHFPALTSVGLNGNGISASEAIPLLLGAAERPELTLTLRNCTVNRHCAPGEVRVVINISTPQRGYLFAGLPAGAGKTVTALRVTRAEMTAKGLQSLAKALDPATLKEIEFRDIAMRNEGAEELAIAFQGFKLETLRLPMCRVQASGVAALAASSVLDSVKILDLSGNTIGKAGAAALANSTHLGSLEKLELSAQKVGSEERKLLKAKFGNKLVL